jgi:hypothetical protein
MNLQIISDHPDSTNKSWVTSSRKTLLCDNSLFQQFFLHVFPVLEDSKLHDYIIILSEFFSVKKNIRNRYKY